MYGPDMEQLHVLVAVHQLEHAVTKDRAQTQCLVVAVARFTLVPRVQARSVERAVYP